MVDPTKEEAVADNATEEKSSDACDVETKEENKEKNGTEESKVDEVEVVKAEPATNEDVTGAGEEKDEGGKADEETKDDDANINVKKGKVTSSKGDEKVSNNKASKDVAEPDIKADEGDEDMKVEDKAGKPEGEDVEMKDSSKDNKKRKSKAPPAEIFIKRERRERKSVETFDPNEVDRPAIAVVIPGRGKALLELAKTRASIERANADDILSAYKLIFTNRKAAKNDMMSSVLAFSGYLPPLEMGASKAEQHEIDEEYEVKMGDRAYKLSVPQLRKLCDLFCVDRSDYKGKDSLVDALLDFLGEPDEKMMKGTALQKRSDKKGKDKKADAEEQENREYDDVDDDKLQETANNELPSDDMLRKWVRAYVRCHNMKTSSVKDAIRIASEKFDVDITSQKARLKELLTEEI